MDFLALVQRVFDESAVQGTAPTTLSGATGFTKRLKNWVDEAWRKIQTSRPNWKWMRATATAQTVIGQQSYAPSDSAAFNLSRWARWVINSFRCYETAVGVSDEQFLTFMPYDDFRDIYQFGTQTSDRPQFISFDPQGNVLLGPKPDKVYTIYGDYFKSPQALTANGDTPEMPSEFHMAIVFRALMRYATFDAAPEVYDDAKNDFDAEIARLELDQLEPIDTNDVTLVE